MKRSKVLISIAILTLITASLACSLFGGKSSEDIVATDSGAESAAPESATGDNQAAESDEPQNAASANLGEEYRSEEGGYAFRPIPDYQLEEFFGLASMTAPDGDPDLGPMLMLIGGTNEDAATEDEIFNEFMQDAEGEDIEILDQKEITVDGKPGILADIGGDVDGQQVTGRIVVVAVTPTQQFTMFASAPKDRWDEVKGLFDAVLASVNFFEPQEIDLSEGLEIEEGNGDNQAIAPQVEAESLSQWASFAFASSEYGSDDWSAMQATGEPDTFECGDQTTAWASSSSNTVEWIELTYDVAVIPTEINIYETYYPDQVVKVEVADLSMAYFTVYEATPSDHTEGDCPYILSIQTDTNQAISSVRITVDQSVLTNWNEIDAVELVGISDQAAIPVSPSDTGLPDFASFPSTYSELPPGGFAYLLAITSGGMPVIVSQGNIQDQSTSAEHVIGLVSEDQQNTVTLFIPLNVSPGILVMNPYEDSSATKNPGSAVYKGLALYTNTNGIINIEDMQGNTISGSFAFMAVDESGEELSVSGFFNQLPLIAP